MSDALRRRQDVLDLRIRLERTAIDAFVQIGAPAKRPPASQVDVLLLFLVGCAAVPEQPQVHRLARLGAHVYRRTSDVLHGRTNALDLSDVVVAEWRTIVEDMEAVLAP